ncbi:hypothetical protein [Streptomyces sp. VRA16 Mangrove soil]|uniref:hypothetical protein n=1 Tax=Streptomyces sp. VRA16 Mangrove soil TaxID=2817434 RepID=UPI001A9D23BE|nr:hypothetical protein [Streptomyces sp. VRA16 Mangrove soil]MBO1332046.1 hypothetical protein [Streptomyces sp. VRA16 Mangrove soil]
MRTTRALAVSAAAFAAVGLAAPAASAWDNPTSLSVSPSVIPRGGQVTVSVDGTKCQSGSTASSDAFGTVNLTAVPGGSQATGTATVHDDASVGAHDVSVNCQGVPLTRPAAFTVIHGGVRGGLGGSTETGATPTDMAIGGALVASALIGGGVFWMRRRAENRA